MAISVFVQKRSQRRALFALGSALARYRRLKTDESANRPVAMFNCLRARDADSHARRLATKGQSAHLPRAR